LEHIEHSSLQPAVMHPLTTPLIGQPPQVRARKRMIGTL
jgi:hypothetical protein